MMTQTTQNCLARFPQVVDRVLDNAKEVLDNGLTESHLTALESIKIEFSQIRTDLQRRSSEFPELQMSEKLNRQMVAADYYAFMEYQEANPSLVIGYDDVKCDEFGRIRSLYHLGGRAEQLATLEMLSGIDSLFFLCTRVEDGARFSRLPALKNLTVNYHSMKTANIAPMASLEHFQGKNCWMDDLNWLRHCPRLKVLELPSSEIQSTMLPKLLGSVEFLDLSDNPLESIAALKGHPAIQIVSLQKTRINDLSPLLTLPSLRALRISEDMLRVTGFAECQEYLLAKGGVVGVVNS